MSKIIPPARPRISYEKAWAIVKEVYEADKKPVPTKPVILAIRGYYEDSMGKPDQNDRGIYDDAFLILNPILEDIRAFNGNTDPSTYRMPVISRQRINGEWHVVTKKGMAVLNEGVYTAVRHVHRGKYRAFQLTNPSVTRDGGATDEGQQIAINIHYGDDLEDGRWTGTWSEGCQTLPKNQWLEFYRIVSSAMTNYKLLNIPYILVGNNQNKYI